MDSKKGGPVTLDTIYQEIKQVREAKKQLAIREIFAVGVAIAFLGSSIWASTLDIYWRQFNALGLMIMGGFVIIACWLWLIFHRENRNLRSTAIVTICFLEGVIIAAIITAFLL